MKTDDLRKMSVSELQKELASVQRELFNLRMQKGTDQLSRPHVMREVRHNIARVKTILKEKELEGAEHE